MNDLFFVFPTKGEIIKHTKITVGTDIAKVKLMSFYFSCSLDIIEEIYVSLIAHMKSVIALFEF